MTKLLPQIENKVILLVDFKTMSMRKMMKLFKELRDVYDPVKSEKKREEPNVNQTSPQ